MAYGVQERVQRITAMCGDANQPGRGHHAGDALFGEVGAVVELVEARGRRDLAAEYDQIAVVDGRRAVNRRQDAQSTGRLARATEHVVKPHSQPAVSLPRD